MGNVMGDREELVLLGGNGRKTGEFVWLVIVIIIITDGHSPEGS